MKKLLLLFFAIPLLSLSLKVDKNQIIYKWMGDDGTEMADMIFDHEKKALIAFKLFCDQEFDQIIDEQFCGKELFFEYVLASLTLPDGFDISTLENTMEEQRLEFKSKFKESLIYNYNKGIEEYGIDWSGIEIVSIETKKNNIDMPENRGQFEQIIPIITFTYDDQPYN